MVPRTPSQKRQSAFGCSIESRLWVEARRWRRARIPAADYGPRWSPDGRFIAFLRELSKEKSVLLLIPALGGPERKIAEIFAVHSVLMPGPYLAWSPDGNSLVISDKDSLKEPFALFLLSIETAR